MNRTPSLATKAQRALRDAMVKVVEENRRLGLPLVMWRDGKVVHVPAGKVKISRRG